MPYILFHPSTTIIIFSPFSLLSFAPSLLSLCFHVFREALAHAGTRTRVLPKQGIVLRGMGKITRNSGGGSGRNHTKGVGSKKVEKIDLALTILRQEYGEQVYFAPTKFYVEWPRADSDAGREVSGGVGSSSGRRMSTSQGASDAGYAPTTSSSSVSSSSSRPPSSQQPSSSSPSSLGWFKPISPAERSSVSSRKIPQRYTCTYKYIYIWYRYTNVIIYTSIHVCGKHTDLETLRRRFYTFSL